tara:strand:- start:595 stop:735 length:141 start_codon:yes stop_codon:yes gene_type:complete
MNSSWLLASILTPAILVMIFIFISLNNELVLPVKAPMKELDTGGEV